MGLFTTAISLDRPVDQPAPEDVQAYNDAANNRDAKGLLSIAAKNPDSELGRTALNAGTVVAAGNQTLSTIVAPIVKAGDVQTPEGRIAAQKTFETVKDHPQYGTALVRWLLGDKQGASNMLTGGDPTSTIVWDAEGNPYTKTINALGQIISVTDKDNTPLSMQDVAARKISYGNYADTIAAKNKTQAQDLYVKAFAKDTEATNAWSQFSASANNKAQRIKENLPNINDVPADIFNDVMGIVTQSVGNGASSSQNSSILKNWQKGEGVRTGEQISKEAQSALKLGGVWSFDGKGGIVNDKGETKSFSKLEQEQNTQNSAKENSNNIQQARDSILKRQALGQLTEANAAKLLDALKSSQEIMNEQADVLTRHGRPAFTSLPSGFNIEDKVSQWEAQTHQMEYNKRVMDAFQEFKTKAMEQYNKTGMYPGPQELEAQFIKTPEYRALQDIYSEKIQGSLDKSRVRPGVEVKQESSGKNANTSIPTVGMQKKYNNKWYEFKGGDPNQQSNWSEVK